MADVIEFEDGIKEISERADTTQSEVFNHVQAAKEEFNGLLTEESAVIYVGQHIYGVDLVELCEPEPEFTPINKVTPEMQYVNVEGVIHKKGSPFTYEKKGETRHGRELKLTDGTGHIDFMFWGEREVREPDNLAQGDKIQVVGASASEYNGDVNIHFGKDTDITVVEPVQKEQKVDKKQPVANTIDLR